MIDEAGIWRDDGVNVARSAVVSVPFCSCLRGEFCVLPD